MMRWAPALVAAVLLFAAADASFGSDDTSGAGASACRLRSCSAGRSSLIDQDGMVRTDEDFHGRFVLLYFGYTYCPDICPTALQEISAALEHLGEDGRAVQPVFVTIDPKRDTPMVLRDYVAQFGDRFVGLGGTENQIRGLAKAYRLHRVKVVPDWSESDEDYLVDHSSLTFLLGPDGKVMTLFPHNTPGDTMAMRLRAYLMPDAGG